jgi:diadenosine tetraphosphate (Ap4A) HIT family hydrolase
MNDWKNDRIGSAEKGENPTVMVKMKSGFAVIGDNQFLPGYCVLLGYPKANSLNELSLVERNQYLTDMTLVGDAIIKTCNPLRINYSILMNLDHYLHAHIEARYDWEPEEYKSRPSYFYPKEQRHDKKYEYNEETYGELKKKITENLLGLMKQVGY